MKYIDAQIRKIQRLAQALTYIRIYPQEQDAYRNLYDHYIRAYPYLSKNYTTRSCMASHLGPFMFLEYVNQKNLNHTFEMQYLDYVVKIEGTRHIKVTSSKFTWQEEFETNYLHPLQSSNTKELQPSIEYLFDSLN